MRKWMYKEKIIRKIVKVSAILCFYSMLLLLSGCTRITSVSKDDFIHIIAEELEIAENRIKETSRIEEVGESILYRDSVSEVFIAYEQLAPTDDAKTYIQWWDHDMLGSIGFDGKLHASWRGSSGYSLFSGISENVTKERGDEFDCVMYGGVYVTDGQAYRVFTIRKDSIEIVDRILDKTGFPKP